MVLFLIVYFSKEPDKIPWYLIALEVFADFFFWFGFFLIVLMFPILSGFGVMGTGGAIIVCLVLLYLELIH
jgi:hypothetical protein